jgi:hypothetical protein
MDSSDLGNFAALSAISGALLVGFLILLIPMIFFLLTLQKALMRVAPERRTMNPPMVWLDLIPLFGIVWNFIMVTALSKSLGAELTARNIPHENEPGKTFGLVWASLSAACLVPGLGFLLFIPVFVLWIIYWVKIAGFSAKLGEQPFTNPS